jgi:hypothetical protein
VSEGRPSSPVPRPPALLTGVVVAASVMTGAAAVLAWSVGALGPWIAGVSLLAGLGGGVLAVREVRRSDPEAEADGTASAAGGERARLSALEILALVAFAAVSLRQFGWVVFERAGELRTLLGYNYGDLPLHWTYARFVANGAPFWPANPILTGERLRYPFGIDLLTSALLDLGIGMRALLPVMGLAGAAATAVALRRWGGALAVSGLLFAGGLAGFQVLWTGRLADYQNAVEWKSLYLALFVPQRGLLLALPAGLLLLWSWRRRLLRGERGLAPWVEGVVWGTLPLVHLHTFLVVSLLVGFWSLATGRVRDTVPTLAWAVLPASWAVFEVTEGFRAASLMGWAPGWTMGAANPLAFLAVNFGLFLPLALAALIIAWRGRHREDLLVLGPALVLFAALFLVRVAPWAWDNTKVMLWCYLLALPSIGARVLAPLSRPWRVVALVGLLFSGAVSVTAASIEVSPRLEILNLAEYDAVCQALASAPVTERVATASTFNHPVALCGHPIVAGYPGHLWSHGLDATRVQRGLARLMEGGPGWREEAHALGARVLFWGPREQAAWPTSRRPWERQSRLLALGPWGALFRLE